MGNIKKTDMKISLLLVLLFFTFSASAAANKSVTVNALNYPVQVERNQSLVSLAPGSELFEGDRVKTGTHGRAWLSMPDGSVVKLGQNTEFEIRTSAFHVEQGNAVFEAAWNVIKGAFRFTSGFFPAQFPTTRKVNIGVGAVTIGVRGTDLWGRSTREQDFVTLLEGNVTIEAEGQPPVELNQPLMRYLKQSGKPAAPVASLKLPEVKKLGAETELSAQRGIANLDGRIELVLISLKDLDRAKQLVARMQQAGYAVETEYVMINYEDFKRIKLTGFVSREAARSLAKQIKAEFQLDGAWVKERDY